MAVALKEDYQKALDEQKKFHLYEKEIMNLQFLKSK